jgi:SAM-dependent methyltransferase
LSISYDPSRFAALAAVEQDHFWFRSRARLILWALRRHFPRARSVLEVGCGTGNVLAEIRNSGFDRVVGSEALSEGLAFAARRVPGAELLQMDARRIPFREEFDVVAAFDVIEHIDEDEQVLAGMHAACRPGGGVMITVPQHAWLWSARDEFAGHRRRYGRAELLRKLAAAGFVRPWTSSFMTLLLPLMVLSRRRKQFKPSGELEIGAVANRLLTPVMALERGLIAAGLRFPAGGSLLAIAHKAPRQE